MKKDPLERLADAMERIAAAREWRNYWEWSMTGQVKTRDGTDPPPPPPPGDGVGS